MNKLNRIILYLFVFTVPFQQSVIIPGIGSLNKLLGIILVVTVLFTVLSNKKIKKLPLIFVILLLFLLINIASLFWGSSLSDSLSQLILYVQLFFIFWTIYEFLDTKERIQNSLKAFVMGCTVVAIMSLQAYLTSGTPAVGTSRFVLEGYNPNALGILWVIGIIISIYLFFNASKKYFIFIPLSVFVILLTGSRTALLLMLFVALASLWYMYRHKVRFRKTITLAMIVLSVIVYNKIPQAQLNRLGTINEEFSSGDLNGRTAIWESGIRAFSENPIAGVGIGSFQEVSALYSTSGIEMSSHNSYLTILVENGLLGFIIFTLFLAVLFIYAWKTKGDINLRWLNLTLMTMWLILSFASHAESQKYTWIIFGIIISIYYIDKKLSVRDGVGNAI